MRVNPNSDASGPIDGLPVKRKTRGANSQDNDSFVSSTRLTRAVEKSHLVRADKVAKARALIANPSYPDDATLKRVAGALAKQVRPPTSSE